MQRIPAALEVGAGLRARPTRSGAIVAAVILVAATHLPGTILADEGRGWNPSPTDSAPHETADATDHVQHETPDAAKPAQLETSRARPAWLDALDLSGFLAVESRGFLEAESHPGQDAGHGSSLVLSPELYHEWRDGDASWTFEPFVRLDSVDAERSHWDIRDLSYTRASQRWELTLGISRVFWGVTESQHLVDIVNQTDLVENPDGEDKLGQPMIRGTYIDSWGIVELFVLPGFRERTFPGEDGRLRPGLPIDTDNPVYESSAGEWHTDWAIRWSHAVGAFDLGLSYFAGTSREPLLVPNVVPSGATEGRAVEGSDLADPETLVPHYPLITQTGLDAQATLGSWLL